MIVVAEGDYSCGRTTGGVQGRGPGKIFTFPSPMTAVYVFSIVLCFCRQGVSVCFVFFSCLFLKDLIILLEINSGV